MKKLIIAAAVAAMGAGAFAAPLVYDYKASVKHMYEKEGTITVAGVKQTAYFKYVKSAKIEGYFVQDLDGQTKLAVNSLGTPVVTTKRGFLVVINRSAEKNYRAPKILPAQLDVKVPFTAANKRINEAYFYAGPFASRNDAASQWHPQYDGGLDYLINSSIAAAPSVSTRAWGTCGSTLYLFGQHNMPNAITPTGVAPIAPLRYAFGDSWLNGAGFGTSKTTPSALCCGWATAGGATSVNISGNLKGGLFLCSIGGQIANITPFMLGAEDLFVADVANARASAVNWPNAVVANIIPGVGTQGDLVIWSDGELALATTDAVSGSWQLKPTAKLSAAALAPAEVAAMAAWVTPATVGATVYPYLKAANQKLDGSYPFLATTEPVLVNGGLTDGLVSDNFGSLFL